MYYLLMSKFIHHKVYNHMLYCMYNSRQYVFIDIYIQTVNTLSICAMKNTPIQSHYTSWLIGVRFLWV